MAVSESLSSGVCPKCGSTEVFRNAESRGERIQLAISSTLRFFLATYVCTACGHFEELIPPEELKNEKLVGKIKESWHKVR